MILILIGWRKITQILKKLLELTKSLGLRQIIKDVTRPTLNKNSFIDLTLTNSDNIDKSGTIKGRHQNSPLKAAEGP